MKKKLIFYSLFVSMAIFLWTFPTYSNELFSINQRQQIVKVIDNVCADSWCEGDFNYEFIDFQCSRINNSCDLIFYFINTDNDNEIKSKLQYCHFFNILKIEQVLEGGHSLNDHFYEALDACISDLSEVVQFN